MRYGRERGGSRGFGERRERGSGGFRRESGYGGGGGFRQAPVKVGEEYDVQITDVAAKGDGIARIEGFIIFVPGTTRGDSCRIRVKEVARRFAVAEKVGEATSAPTSEASETRESEALETEEGEETGMEPSQIEEENESEETE